MASLNMYGPYELSADVVREKVKENKVGNYAYGVYKEGIFYVWYVGRSDNDLRTEIINRAEKKQFTDCTHFKFSYASTIKEAYEKECQNFHDFGGPEKKLLNENHPDCPNGKIMYKCPVCNHPNEN